MEKVTAFHVLMKSPDRAAKKFGVSITYQPDSIFAPFAVKR